MRERTALALADQEVLHVLVSPVEVHLASREERIAGHVGRLLGVLKLLVDPLEILPRVARLARPSQPALVPRDTGSPGEQGANLDLGRVEPRELHVDCDAGELVAGVLGAELLVAGIVRLPRKPCKKLIMQAAFSCLCPLPQPPLLLQLICLR